MTTKKKQQMYAWNVARMRRVRNLCGILVAKYEERGHMGKKP
jgi:hypothetical protein